MSACPKSQEFELKSCYKSLVSVRFYGCMLSSSIETKHLVEFKQALCQKDDRTGEFNYEPS